MVNPANRDPNQRVARAAKIKRAVSTIKNQCNLKSKKFIKMNISEVIKNLAIKSGIKADNPELTALLENESLREVEVDDTLAGTLNGKLISMEAAKNHPEIRKVYTARALDGVDEKIGAALDLLEIAEEDRAPFTQEKNTYAKIDILAGLLKSVKESKKEADPADKKQYQKTIDDLQKELKAQKAAAANKENEFNSIRKKDRLNYALRNKIQKIKTILDNTTDSAKFATCSTVIDALLKEHNAELVADENGELVLQTINGDKVYNNETNTEIKPDEFLELALSRNKLLTVAQPAQPSQDPVTVQGNGKPGGNADTLDSTKKAAIDHNKRILDLMG